MRERVALRPVAKADLPALIRVHTDAEVSGEFQWFGFRVARARELERRWEEDGLIGAESSTLAIDLGDGTCAGALTWRPVEATGNVEIGICVFPEHRGHGIGTEAQRQLVEYLFSTTPVHRVQAKTELGNVAEERALASVGFSREGVLRGYGFRDGRWRDGVIFGLLRDDPRRPPGA